METTTTFDPNNYSYNGVVVIDANGTGHAQACGHAAAAIAERGPEAVVLFSAGGFDLFCEHDCFADILPRREHPMVDGPSMDAPTFGEGSAAPKAPTPEGDEMTVEQVEEWLLGLGRKVEVHEVTQVLIAHATDWAKDWRGTFSFMVDMSKAAHSSRGLTKGQAKGVLNCWRADLNRRPPVQKSGAKELDLSELPAGMYAVPNGETRLKVSVRKPGANSRWDGWIFVSDGAEYGSQKTYGKQAPDSIYVGDIEEQLEAILADPLEASKAYGKLVGKCGACGRKLEDEESIAKGIGPICERKF